MIYTFIKTKSDKKGIIFKTPKSLNYDKKGRKSLPPTLRWEGSANYKKLVSLVLLEKL